MLLVCIKRPNPPTTVNTPGFLPFINKFFNLVHLESQHTMPWGGRIESSPPGLPTKGKKAKVDEYFPNLVSRPLLRYQWSMKNPIPFDTHAFVKKLGAAGVPEPQAEVLAEAIGEAIIERLVTKEDLNLLKQDLSLLKQDLSLLKQDLHLLKQELRGDLQNLELRITIRFGAMLAASVAVIAALVKLL